MQEPAARALIQMVPLLIFSFIGGFVALALARDKGRNILLWTVLGFIPFVNMFCIPFFIGAANLRLEKKVDEMLKILSQNSNSSAASS
jgi:hypothetical protein